MSVGYLAVMALLATPPPLPPQQTAAPRVAFEPYVVATFDGGRHEVELGRVTVPENRARPNGAAIRLAFLRLRATAVEPGPPTVFLMGGPGIPASLIAQVPPYWQLFDRLRALGDVILLDQRGVGLSEPKLDCPATGRAPARTWLTSATALEHALRAPLLACAQHWRSRGVDPRSYTVAATADDVFDLSRALGAERLNLLGFSFGTQIAIELLRRHPSVAGRVVLQGTLGPAHTVRLPSRQDETLRAVATAAAAASGEAGYPDLVEGVRNLRRAAQMAPFQVRVLGLEGDSLTLTVGGEALAALLQLRLGDRRFPALVTSLMQGDYRVLARMIEATYRDLAGPGAGLVNRALPCSSPGTPERHRQAAAEAETGALGEPFENRVVLPGYCGALGGSLRDPTPAGPLSVAAPTLFITGSLDDRTPPANVDELQPGFADAGVVVAQNGGHELLPVPEIQDLVLRFLHGERIQLLTLELPWPKYATIEEAIAPPPPRPPGPPGPPARSPSAGEVDPIHGHPPVADHQERILQGSHDLDRLEWRHAEPDEIGQLQRPLGGGQVVAALALRAATSRPPLPTPESKGFVRYCFVNTLFP